MKSPILILSIFSQSFFCFANSRIDSLKNELQLEHPDTTKAIILSQLSFHYHSENIDSGIHYSQKAYEFAAKNEYIKGLQSSLNSLGINYLNGGKLDSALITFRKLKDITDTSNAALVATIYTNMALVYQSFSDYPKAIDYYYKAILLYKEAKLIDRIYGISHNMGMIYVKQKDLEKAKTHYRQLLRSAIKENDTIQFSKFYKSLGNVFTI